MSGSLAVADVDIGRLRYQRQRNGSFHQMPRLTRDIQRLTLGPAHDAPLPADAAAGTPALCALRRGGG